MKCDEPAGLVDQGFHFAQHRLSHPEKKEVKRTLFRNYTDNSKVYMFTFQHALRSIYSHNLVNSTIQPTSVLRFYNNFRYFHALIGGELLSIRV